MKVCVINNIYPPYDRGGAEQVVVKSVEGLLAAGHEVMVLTSSPQGSEQTHQGNLHIYRCPAHNIFFYTDAHTRSLIARFLWHVIDIWNVATARWVRRKLQEIKPDVVHTHNLMGLSFLIPSVIRRLGLRHVHTVHDVQLVEPSAMILKAKETSWRYTGFPSQLYTAIMRRAMNSPHVVISPSQFLRDFYTRRKFFPRSQFEIIRNPVTFSPTRLSQTSRQGAGERPFRFLYLGQVEYHKGIFVLLEAFKKIADSSSSVELHIVGDGSDFDTVKKEASKIPNVVIHGRKDRASLPALFQTMDVTVVPSLCYENSPTVIFESFAFGIPVLASNSEGIAELIDEGHNGMTFISGDSESLLEKMRWSVRHPEALSGMQAAAFASLAGLSQQEYVCELERIYENG